MIFNKERCIDNIYRLARAKGKKIGDLEEVAGVSRGYLSRINKPDAASPAIETLTAIATELSVSVDFLLSFDCAYSDNEKLMAEFIDALMTKTVSKTIEWATDHYETLTMETHQEIENDHPLFDVDVQEDFDERELYSREFHSHFDNDNTHLAADCFHTDIDPDNKLYIMVVYHQNSAGHCTQEAELYLCKEKTIKPLCCSYWIRDEIANKIRLLVSTIRTANCRISIDSDTEQILENFIKDNQPGSAEATE